jgi:hypothetical protein
MVGASFCPPFFNPNARTGTSWLRSGRLKKERGVWSAVRVAERGERPWRDWGGWKRERKFGRAVSKSFLSSPRKMVLSLRLAARRPQAQRITSTPKNKQDGPRHALERGDHAQWAECRAGFLPLPHSAWQHKCSARAPGRGRLQRWAARPATDPCRPGRPAPAHPRASGTRHDTLPTWVRARGWALPAVAGRSAEGPPCDRRMGCPHPRARVRPPGQEAPHA